MKARNFALVNHLSHHMSLKEDFECELWKIFGIMVMREPVNLEYVKNNLRLNR